MEGARRSRGEGRNRRLAGGVPGEADAVVAVGVRLGGQQGGHAVGPRQPRVATRLQRRLRRVHQRRRGRRLLLATGDRGHPHRRRPSLFLPGQGGLCRRRSTAPLDPACAGAASPTRRRPEVTEEDEAPGGPAAGAVPVGRERWPSPGDAVAAESLHGAVQGERQTGDKAGAFFLLEQAEKDRLRGRGAGTREGAAGRWRLRAPRPQHSGAGLPRRTSCGCGSLTDPEPSRWYEAAPDG